MTVKNTASPIRSFRLLPIFCNAFVCESVTDKIGGMTIVETPRVFGTPVHGANYVLRPGAYSVIRSSTGKIAVVTTPAGCFLPGGGQEKGESLEEAATREAAEECGLRIRIGSRIGVADELVYSADERTYFRKRCAFFLARVVASDVNPAESDHLLTWLKPDEAIRRLTHESQRWAVQSMG